MDHAKTKYLHEKTKDLDELIKLHLSMTSILAHGRGDVRCTHYGLNLYSHEQK